MSWYSNWLPTSLPSLGFALPSRFISFDIQRTFISFVLKKSLGHLLKPGQLDIQQIDSQLGSGYVQVNNVELDNEAINNALVGLPIKLYEGTISSVTARVPWPNPLTSTVGLSIDSLQLTFHVLPLSEHARSVPNLAESVASVADSFIHELSPREEASLRESFHPDLASSTHSIDDHNVPGGLDPFISAPEEEEAFSGDADPPGISIFATLIERLLARFEFNAANTNITLVHPDHTDFTVCIPEIVYCTEQRPDGDDVGSALGATRMVTISGLSITATDCRPASPTSHTPTSSVSKPSSSLTYMDSPRRTHSPEPEPRSASPASSSSSLDDDAQFAMSQSLAFLPPRSASPASSVASSMYQSAISDTETRGRSTPSPGTQQPAVTVTVPPTVPPSQETLKPTPSAEVIFSIGAEPIVIRLEMQTSDPNDVRRGDGAVADDIKLSVDIGLIACALRAWHIKGVTEMLDIVTGSLPSDSSPSPPNPSAKQAMALTLRARLRGAVLLLLPAEEHSMSIFFSRPLVPPKLPHSYLRIHLETMSALMASPQSRTTSSEADTFTFSLSDISAFVFRASDPGQDAALSASPLLITDHHLHIQYSPSHLHPDSVVQHDLPAFALIDWTDASHQLAGMKVSHWKTKVAPKHGKSARRASQVDAAIPPSGSPSASALPPAVMLTGKRSMSKHNLSSTIVDIVVEPLHVFLDLDFATSRVLLTFLDEINNGSGGPSKEDSEQITPPASPQLRRPPGAKERQRQRLENMVLEDLDLDFDYRSDISDKNRRPRAKARSPTTTVNVKSQMIRVQVRCPPPSGHSVRSGALVLDIHDINVSLGSAPKKSKARFDSQHEADPLAVQPMLSAGFRRILVACCAAGEGKASAFLSVGPLGGSEDTEFPVLLPKITLSKSAPRGSRDSGPATIALAVQIPSVYAHLSKPLFDSLQYLADDVAQLMENVFGSGNGGGEKVESRDGSLIGSRFFAKSRSGSGSGLSTGSDPPKSQSVIKLEVTEAFVRVMLPRTSTTIRPFDITASDLGISVQVKPEGKDETVVGVTAMGLDVKNTNTTAETLLSLTTPRGLASAAKPLVNLAFTSLVVPETAAKESRIKLSLWGFTCSVSPDVQWANDLALFFKPPPGAFEAVVPSERTLISLKVTDGSIRVRSSIHPGALVVHAGALDFHTSVVGDTPDSSFHISVQQLAVLMIDDLADAIDPGVHHSGTQRWRKSGFALLTEVSDLDLAFKKSPASPSLETLVVIERVGLQLHLCADSLSAVADFSKDLAVSFNPPSEEDLIPKPKPAPAVVSPPISHESLMASVDDLAFKRVPEVGPPPDMINDDLPTNMEYLDESFGAAAGMRELLEEDLEESDVDDDIDAEGAPEIVSKVGGETIKILRPEGLNIVEHYFDNLPPDTSDGSLNLGASTTRVRVHKGDIKLFLYDGYDWKKTRRTIEEEIKEMRRRLAKIRQLVAGGQTQETGFEEVNTVLFNSVYIGLEQDIDELEPTALIAAIDEELKDDLDTTSQSSWQSLKSPSGAAPQARSSKTRGKRLTRSKTPSIEFQLMGVEAEVDQFRPDEPVAGRTFFTVKDLAILDHIKTSTWKKFLTDLRSDARGNVRETDSNMVRVELRSVRPTPGHPSEEARLRAKILPLRLYVDQDALDFLKKFFSFKDPHSPASTVEADSDGDIYFQLVEVFPVDLKLDYKPRRVDYRALKEGKTIELMNFFHFDGAEMTLRHITMAGVTGWPRMFDMLNDLWTPDVKATQLVDVISGVAPIRSVVNVGSGVADLVLLPIAQYKKDGRIVRGVQKGTTAFFKSTAVEAIKLGARLATGTQVILEQAEDVLGGQFKNPVTTEAVQPGQYGSDEDEEPDDLISKYAEQPVDLREGMQSAYHSLRRNLNSAAQTILAVPMEVYERSGNEGPVRSVIRAVPIAVLKPMIGASEAVSKTLLGLHNTLDPNVRHENEAKYKHR